MIDGNPRVLVTPTARSERDPPARGRLPEQRRGGRRRHAVYGAQAWRFLPDDFRMASRYGVPEGSSLADWPITYDDLAPYYERAEWEIGVSGDGDGNRNQGAARQAPIRCRRCRAMPPPRC